MKTIFNLLLVLFSLSVFSQQEVTALDINLSPGTQVLEVTQKNQKQISLFFHGGGKTKLLTLDQQFKIADSLSVNNSNEVRYADLIGYGLSDKNYFCYLASQNNKNIFCQHFDLNSHQVTLKSFRLEFEKEKILAKISIEDVFFIVALTKNSSLLNLYSFKNGLMDKKTIDLSSKRFLDLNNKVANLWDIISKETPCEGAFYFQTITDKSLPSLVLNANKRKLYGYDNQLIFSLDTNRKFTQTFSVNLNDFSVAQKVYSQPYFEDKITQDDNPETYYSSQSSTSFLSKNHCIQMRIEDKIVKLSIKKVSGEEIKSLEINSGQEVSFKNSEIYIEKSDAQNLKTIDKPDQFVKKLNGLNAAVSLQESKDKFLLTLGGMSFLDSTDGALIGGMIGGFTGAVLGTAIMSNSLANASTDMDFYKNRKVLYTSCLFDKSLDHIDGLIKTTAFDALRLFAEKNASGTIKIAFKMNDDLYHGFYNAETKKYLLYLFSN